MEKNEEVAYFRHIKSFLPNDFQVTGLTAKFQQLKYAEINELADKKYVSKLTFYQFTAFGVVLPVYIAPDITYNIILAIAEFKDFQKIPQEYQLLLLIKLVRASVLIRKSQELFKRDILQTLYAEKPVLLLPLLYLSAQIKTPQYIDQKEVVFTKTHRHNCLLLYYLGANYLLAHDFESAEIALLEAYLLSKFCKDIRDSIISKLSLASFLNHTPYSVLCSHLPAKHYPSGEAQNIWYLDSRYVQFPRDEFYSEFTQLINLEHARRVIIDYAQVASQMNLADLYKACCTKSLDQVFKSIPDLEYEIKGSIIIFKGISLKQAISTELTQLSKQLATEK